MSLPKLQPMSLPKLPSMRIPTIRRTKQLNAYVRQTAIATGLGDPDLNMCVGCNHPNFDFHDDCSEREYGISKLCQNCQDEVFGNMEDDNG